MLIMLVSLAVHAAPNPLACLACQLGQPADSVSLQRALRCYDSELGPKGLKSSEHPGTRGLVGPESGLYLLEVHGGGPEREQLLAALELSTLRELKKAHPEARIEKGSFSGQKEAHVDRAGLEIATGYSAPDDPPYRFELRGAADPASELCSTACAPCPDKMWAASVWGKAGVDWERPLTLAPLLAAPLSIPPVDIELAVGDERKWEGGALVGDGWKLTPAQAGFYVMRIEPGAMIRGLPAWPELTRDQLVASLALSSNPDESRFDLVLDLPELGNPHITWFFEAGALSHLEVSGWASGAIDPSKGPDIGRVVAAHLGGSAAEPIGCLSDERFPCMADYTTYRFADGVEGKGSLWHEAFVLGSYTRKVPTGPAPEQQSGYTWDQPVDGAVMRRQDDYKLDLHVDRRCREAGAECGDSSWGRHVGERDRTNEALDLAEKRAATLTTTIARHARDDLPSEVAVLTLFASARAARLTRYAMNMALYDVEHYAACPAPTERLRELHQGYADLAVQFESVADGIVGDSGDVWTQLTAMNMIAREKMPPMVDSWPELRAQVNACFDEG